MKHFNLKFSLKLTHPLKIVDRACAVSAIAELLVILTCSLMTQPGPPFLLFSLYLFLNMAQRCLFYVFPFVFRSFLLLRNAILISATLSLSQCLEILTTLFSLWRLHSLSGIGEHRLGRGHEDRRAEGAEWGLSLIHI